VPEPRLGEGEAVGELAIVLHSHMPYVEGFGTYPFGEEWLFDGYLRSYLPVLDVARDVTFTITPVLADQLEAPGVPARLREFSRELRLGCAREDARNAKDLADSALGELARYERADAQLAEIGDELLAPFIDAAGAGRIELIASSATHAVLPLVASTAGRRLQICNGLRSHRRRFGETEGFWLPECAYEPGLEDLLAAEGVRWFCVDRSAYEDDGEALAPIAAGAGSVAVPIDWPTITRVWSLDGYPSDPHFADFHSKSLIGTRLWSIGAGPYDPAAASEAAQRYGRDFATVVADRLRAHRERHGSPGLLVFAIDTELLGHWWWEGPEWLGALLEALPAEGVRAVRVSDALERHPAQKRELRRSTWGEHKDLSTWDSHDVADLAWGARRLELRLLREVAAGRRDRAAIERATRELLAVQASDWAFLDKRRQAGDYPFERLLGHSHAFHEALEAGAAADPALRALAPELTLAPLLEP
jgi:1,4-alpha-glucan branching enzyme